jgi:hypothetical protein
MSLARVVRRDDLQVSKARNEETQVGVTMPKEWLPSTAPQAPQIQRRPCSRQPTGAGRSRAAISAILQAVSSKTTHTNKHKMVDKQPMIRASQDEPLVTETTIQKTFRGACGGRGPELATGQTDPRFCPARGWPPTRSFVWRGLDCWWHLKMSIPPNAPSISSSSAPLSSSASSSASTSSSSSSSQPVSKYKIVFVGDQGSGKTSIIKAFIDGSFDYNYKVRSDMVDGMDALFVTRQWQSYGQLLVAVMAIH